jgi:hypothetical protein
MKQTYHSLAVWEFRPAILPGAGDTFIKAETGKYSDCQHAPDNRQAIKTG